MIFFN